MTLPQTNAKLLKVSGAGGTPDWDSPDAAGGEKFEGKVDAFFTERRERVSWPGAGGSQGLTFAMRRTLIVDPRQPRIQFEERDEIEFEYRGIVRSAVIDAIEEYDIPNAIVPGSVRLILQEA